MLTKKKCTNFCIKNKWQYIFVDLVQILHDIFAVDKFVVNQHKQIL